MNKFASLALVWASLLLVACSTSEEKPVSETSPASKEVVSETPKAEVAPVAKAEKVKGSMLDMLKKWQPVTCTFSTNEDWQKIDGTMYVDGKQMRYIGKWEIAGKTVEMNMIMKDGFTYSWNSMMGNSGFKMKADLDEKESVDTKESKDEINKEFDLDCNSGVDSSIFELPSEINFQEFAIPVLPKK